MDKVINEMSISFDALSDNEAFARVAVAVFVSKLNPTLEELEDIKTAVSEAVTNAIIHGYENFRGIDKRGLIPRNSLLRNEGKVLLNCGISEDTVYIEIKDDGKGIEDIEKAMQPLYTSKPELDRSGMGFAFMEAFMDELIVESSLGKGTLIRMSKKIGGGEWIDEMPS